MNIDKILNTKINNKLLQINLNLKKKHCFYILGQRFYTSGIHILNWILKFLYKLSIFTVHNANGLGGNYYLLRLFIHSAAATAARVCAFFAVRSTCEWFYYNVRQC